VTAEEIRRLVADMGWKQIPQEEMQITLLAKIAAQLAELLEHFRKVDNAVFNGK
jgi:hypothetical protein